MWRAAARMASRTTRPAPGAISGPSVVVQGVPRLAASVKKPISACGERNGQTTRPASACRTTSPQSAAGAGRRSGRNAWTGAEASIGRAHRCPCQR
jgi:hypothetical protein